MTSQPAVRAPKQDRSRETQERILVATIQSLARTGWQATTTAAVAARCGISRGALQHHFPTREALVLAVLQYLSEDRFEQFQIDDHPPSGVDRFDYLVSRVLEYYASDSFKAALQMWTAATAEPALREMLMPYEDRFARRLYDRVAEVLRADTSDERTHRLVQTTLDLARGLGLADVLRDDSKRRQSIIRFWAGELRSIKRLP